MNTRIRLKARVTDSKLVNSEKIVNNDQQEYTIVIDRLWAGAEILASNGSTIAEITTPASPDQIMQAIKNYLISTLNCTFVVNNTVRDTRGVVMTDVSETVFSVTFSETPDAGVWVLSHDGNSTTDLAPDITSEQLQTALRLLPNLEATVVTGDVSTGFEITLDTVPNPTLTVEENSLAVTEVQSITFDAVPDAGDCDLLYGVETTTIDSTTVASDIETWLQSIDGLEDVAVTGDFTDGFTIVFTNVASPTTIATDNNTLEASETPVIVTVDVTTPYDTVDIDIQEV